jgi:outer membrane receptor protein involved in Fe transport
LHEEEFFSSLSNTVSTLKLRVSWGRTGNQEIGNYQSVTTFGGGATIIYDDQQISTSDPSRMGNPDLKWETNEQTDIGLNFGLFQNRINGEIDFYRRLTTDMLLNIPVPSSNGFSTQLQNAGEMLNTGFEFFVDANIVTGVAGGFNWDVNFSFSTLRNEVLDLGEIDYFFVAKVKFAFLYKILFASNRHKIVCHMIFPIPFAINVLKRCSPPVCSRLLSSKEIYLH